MISKKERRVINAFINCVKSGEFTVSYAVLLIEDQQKYGWLSNAAKDLFYEFLDEFDGEDANPAEGEGGDDAEGVEE